MQNKLIKKNYLKAIVGFRLMIWRRYIEVWAFEIGMKHFLCYLFLHKKFLAQATTYHTSSNSATYVYSYYNGCETKRLGLGGTAE